MVIPSIKKQVEELGREHNTIKQKCVVALNVKLSNTKLLGHCIVFVLGCSLFYLYYDIDRWLC